jgi:hypothetical protein
MSKPTNEIVVMFGQDRDGCIVVTFYEAHGSLVADVEASDLPAKAKGRQAISLTGQVGSLVKRLGLARNPFIANGHQYWSYRPETA